MSLKASPTSTGNGRMGHDRVPGELCRWFSGLAGTTGLALLLIVGQLTPAGACESLTGSERRGLEQGELIVKTKEVEDYPWPEVTVYRWVAASPEEVMGVYVDFDSQVGYLPQVAESRIVRQLSRNSFHVSYEYEVAGPNERHRVLAVVSRSPRGFLLTWDLVTARYARRLSGQMKVEEAASGSIIEYANRVDPGFFGRLLGSPDTTVRRMRETVQALAVHVEQLRAQQQEKLRALVLVLKSMLDEP